MKTNKTLLLILSLSLHLLTINLWSNDQKSTNQNSNNILYLEKLDQNIVSTIETLSAFNYAVGKSEGKVTGLERYKNFLMEMTIECSKIRQFVVDSKNVDDREREAIIRMAILTIRSDVKYKVGTVTTEMNIQNKEYLKNIEIMLSNQKKILESLIIDEEKAILRDGEINQDFLNYHAHHFLFSLLIDFLQPSDFLGFETRNLLTSRIKTLEAELRKEKNYRK